LKLHPLKGSAGLDDDHPPITWQLIFISTKQRFWSSPFMLLVLPRRFQLAEDLPAYFVR